MTGAYIRSLQTVREDAEAATRASPNLRQSFLDWYASLPPVSSHRPFAMAEMEAALGTQGKYLSPILLSLGWQRKRRWTGGGQYSRFWVPPADFNPFRSRTG